MDLIVKTGGKEIYRLELKDGEEIFAGRASDCAIRLEGEKAISRQHIRFFQKDGVWIAQLLSRFGGLIYDGQTVQVLELTPGTRFLVPPYEFILNHSAEDVASLSDLELDRSQSHSHSGSVQTSAAERSMVVRTTTTPVRDEDDFRGNMDATSVGFSTLQPFLKVHYGSTKRGEVFRLEGQVWVAGRDPNAEIFLDDRHISRRHFELSRTNEGFFVADLESANGTQLNGESLAPHEPYKVQSGDRISIMDVEIDFEIRDAEFDVKAQATAPAPTDNPLNPFAEPAMTPFDPGFQLPQAYEQNSGLQPAVQKVERVYSPLHQKGFDFAKNKIRIAIGVGAFILVCVLLSGGGGNKKDPKHQQTSSSSTNGIDGDGSTSFDKLSIENKTAVRDMFNLARNLYLTGKYELCLQELKKLHGMVPFYENSKEITNLCTQGADFAKIKADLDYKQHEKIRREREIQTLTDTCQEKVSKNPAISEDELRTCLAPAIELDPENAKVQELTNLLKMREQEKEDRMKGQAKRQERVRMVNAIYMRAKQKMKSGKLREAIDEYEKLLSNGYPEAGALRSQAEREISSVKKELDTKVSSLLANCQEHIDKARFRAAYDACNGATVEDPKNVSGQSLKRKALSELRREMKAIYEDSVLEESLGNIDAAKEKWKRLLQDDLPSDDFYTKAKLKLQKYGVGI